MLVVQIAVYGLGFYLLCLLFFYVFQDSFIFFPPAKQHGPVENEAVKTYSFEHEGITLRGWLVNPEKAGERFLVYFGGNAEDVSLTMDDFIEVDCASLFIAYRGYGESEGKPGENALYYDGLALVEDVRRRFSPKKLVLLGRSLGSSVACKIAAETEVDGLILVTPFDSVKNLGASRYPWLPVASLLKHRFDSTLSAPKVKCPTLVLYGGADSVVPPVHSRRLLEYFNVQPQVVYVERATHGDIELFPEYWPALLSFILVPEVE